jgi:hypothetical protein
MHLTEGWLLFLVSLSTLGALAWVGMKVEDRFVGDAALGGEANA